MMGVVTERDRMMLRQWAQEHMGEPTAEALMKCTAPKGWDDIASASDVAALRKDIKNMEKVLTATFRAELATEIGEVHKVIGQIRGEQRAQTVTLIVMIFVAMIGQTALARFFPPPPPAPPPAQIVIQSPGE